MQILRRDADESGRITVFDALAVLRRAVIAESLLACPTTTTTTSTSNSIHHDECFEHDDCDFDEDRPYCCVHLCCECDADDHCADEEVCHAEICVPAP